MPEEKSSRSEMSGSAGRKGHSRGEKFTQGTTPGPGEYKCVSCSTGWKVTLEDEKSRLPPCGNCGPGTTAEYEKVGREGRSARSSRT